jgi:hypothetical protein
MFRIIEKNSGQEIRRGLEDTMSSVIEAARWMGALVQQWDESAHCWREV